MKTPFRLASCLLLPLLLTGCDSRGTEALSAPTGSPASAEADNNSVAAETAAEPDLDQVAGRSAARWEMIVATDWIQAYDFIHPAIKEHQSLASYLAGKEHHEYRSPSTPVLIGSEADHAYLELSVLWQTHHPQVLAASNIGDDLTQEMQIIETWIWQDGTWYWSSTERQREFLEKHPDLVK